MIYWIKDWASLHELYEDDSASAFISALIDSVEYEDSEYSED